MVPPVPLQVVIYTHDKTFYIMSFTQRVLSAGRSSGTTENLIHNKGKVCNSVHWTTVLHFVDWLECLGEYSMKHQCIVGRDSKLFYI